MNDFSVCSGQLNLISQKTFAHIHSSSSSNDDEDENDTEKFAQLHAAFLPFIGIMLHS
jgi:hypothetical protein